MCFINNPNIIPELIGGKLEAHSPIVGEKSGWCTFSYLCLTVDPAALGATVLLGERPAAPTLDALAAGPGWRKKKTENGFKMAQEIIDI